MSSIGKQVSSIMATLDAQNFDLGYSKGWDAGLAYARQHIAKEIEATHNPDAFFDGVCRDSEYNETICTHLEDAAIARGKND
jgi:hypothetical protein